MIWVQDSETVSGHMSPFQEEREKLNLLGVLCRSYWGWVMSTHIAKGDYLSQAHWLTLTDTPSEMFGQIPRHLLPNQQILLVISPTLINQTPIHLLLKHILSWNKERNKFIMLPNIKQLPCAKLKVHSSLPQKSRESPWMVFTFLLILKYYAQKFTIFKYW